MYHILQKDFLRLILIKGNACTVFADQNTALGRGNIHLNGIYGKNTYTIKITKKMASNKVFITSWIDAYKKSLELIT